MRSRTRIAIPSPTILGEGWVRGGAFHEKQEEQLKLAIEFRGRSVGHGSRGFLFGDDVPHFTGVLLGYMTSHAVHNVRAQPSWRSPFPCVSVELNEKPLT